ncbi:putative phosphodiesterase [Abditibacterium utsteinense]|uniref:Putative phosphodiesterase n=1 Tax=Abditibacterium utsteinense TaxID=1960156 RepID=A0A2S8SUL8_9BACT|nr:metallophosphoesterase family protein [Abditibacterium utsteinense]PQV64497.1 putative phosphodiesterase [Abditibacterium utsteinense]
MKFLIVSDAHGNRFGLEAVLNCGRDFDEIICLGDVVGYGAHPNQCCEILRARGAICLSGNHDAAALGKIGIEWFNPIASAAILWTREQLSSENRAWLDTLPGERVFENWNFQIVHASLRQSWEEYITDANIALATLTRLSQPLCFFGHTHVAASFSLVNDPAQWRNYVSVGWETWPDGGEIELSRNELNLVNPGSCGQPRDGNPLAKGAIFNSETQKIEIFCVEYDIEAARSAILEAGLPSRLGDRLRIGH